MTHGQPSDNQTHKLEKESQSDRTEKRAVQKAGGEAANGMEAHNKNIVLEVQQKRASRSSGATKDGFTSADSLLPKRQKRAEQTAEEKQEHRLEPHKPEPQKDDDKASVVKAAQLAFASVYKSGSLGITETGKFLKGMGEGEREFIEETGKSLAVAKDYYGQAFKGKVNLGADIKEFSGAIGQTLGTASDYYINQVSKGQANLGKDISEAGKAAGDHWNSLDTEHKGKFFGKEVVPILVPGAVGVVAKEVQSANLVSKASEAITAFASAEKIAQMEQKINQLQGHVQKIGEVMRRPLEPAYATVNDAHGRPVLAETSRADDGILRMTKPEGPEIPKKSGKHEHIENLKETQLPTDYSPVKLTQEALGMKSSFQTFEVFKSMRNGIQTVAVDYVRNPDSLKGQGSFTELMACLERNARREGAKVLRVECEFKNPDLERVWVQRHKPTREGSKYITEKQL